MNFHPKFTPRNPLIRPPFPISYQPFPGPWRASSFSLCLYPSRINKLNLPPILLLSGVSQRPLARFAHRRHQVSCICKLLLPSIWLRRARWVVPLSIPSYDRGVGFFRSLCIGDWKIPDKGKSPLPPLHLSLRGCLFSSRHLSPLRCVRSRSRLLLSFRLTPVRHLPTPFGRVRSRSQPGLSVRASSYRQLPVSTLGDCHKERTARLAARPSLPSRQSGESLHCLRSRCLASAPSGARLRPSSLRGCVHPEPIEKEGSPSSRSPLHPSGAW